MLKKPFLANYKITQYFGERPEYYKQFGFAGHEGIDWGLPVGTELLASEAGKVVRRNDDFKNNAYGIYVVIWHDKLNLATWYCHLSQALVKIGDYVEKGQVIALSGNTGNTTGAHLHWNLCKTDSNGYRIDQNNGYKGFIDGLPYLEKEGTSQIIHDPDECEKIKTGLRIERDHNWDLYKAEETAHNETKKELDKAKTELGSYKQAIADFSKTLDCEPKIEKINAELVALVDIEDKLKSAIDENKRLENEALELRRQHEADVDALKSCKSIGDDLSNKYTVCQTEKGQLYEKLKQYEPDIDLESPSFWQKLIEKLLSIFRKGGDTNDETNQ